MFPPVRSLIYILFVLLFGFVACGPDEIPMDDEQPMTGDLLDFPFAPEAYGFEVPKGFPNLPDSVILSTTVAGVELGRHLFYDPILSEDFTISCSSCHMPQGSFTDNKAVSKGVTGEAGTRSSMSLLNLAWNDTNGFFWDGRSPTLEDQALLPVEDPIEMHNTWPEVISRLTAHEDYPKMFRAAFGITDRKEITKELAAKALAQFQKSLISSGKSKFDRIRNGEAFWTNDDEFQGFQMFFDTIADVNLHAECAHCHGGVLFTSNEYFNNGLQPADNLEQFKDKGLGAVNGEPFDNGKFRAPTLRNIGFTAPYMHDGSLATLEEVVDHYFSGGHLSPNIDGLLNDLRPRIFTEEQKAQLVAFLRTLDDPKFMENPAFQSPF